MVDSGMGMALESKTRREFAAAMGKLVSILSRQAGLKQGAKRTCHNPRVENEEP